MPVARYRRRCPVCREIREYERKAQKYCSIKCGLAARGSEWWKAHIDKLTKARLARGYSRRLQQMKAAGMTDAQIALVQKIIASVRISSHHVGLRSGIRKGWAQACGENESAA